MDQQLLDAILRLVGGVWFSYCDAAGPEHAAKAIEALYNFGSLNADNPHCAMLCAKLARAAQESEKREQVAARALIAASSPRRH